MSNLHPDKYEMERERTKRTVRDEVRKILSSPIDFPEELKSWAVQYPSIAGLQIPVSDIVGLYTTASTVSGLGPGVHGRIGMLRAGSSPFEFVQVTYDGQTGQWVSGITTIQEYSQVAVFSTANTSYTSVTANTVDIWHELRNMDAAGLKPQFRLRAYLQTTGAGNAAYVRIRASTFAAGGTTVTSHNPPGAAELSDSSGTATYLQGDWFEYSGLTIDDMIRVNVQVKATSPSSAALTTTNTLLRWVSK